MRSVTKILYSVDISIVCLKYIPQSQYIALGAFYFHLKYGEWAPPYSIHCLQ